MAYITMISIAFWQFQKKQVNKLLLYVYENILGTYSDTFHVATVEGSKFMSRRALIIPKNQYLRKGKVYHAPHTQSHSHVGRKHVSGPTTKAPEAVRLICSRPITSADRQWHSSTRNVSIKTAVDSSTSAARNL